MENFDTFFDGLVLLRLSDAAAEASRSSTTPSLPCINSSAVHLAGGERVVPLDPLVMVDMARAMVSSIQWWAMGSTIDRGVMGRRKKFIVVAFSPGAFVGNDKFNVRKT